MNSTITKFGYPATLLREYAHWVVLLRPSQVTLGSLILAAKDSAQAFGDLPAEAHSELKTATGSIERALAAFMQYEKLNYLMLMMVDPHVHFHVIPRYNGIRTWEDLRLPDQNWPKPPALNEAIVLSDIQTAHLSEVLRPLF